eukprot:symbB.v1.2.041372.t1/scaffold8113.1/size7644/1
MESQLSKELEALLSQPTLLSQRGRELWQNLAKEGNGNPRAVPVVLGCFFLRAVQSGVQVKEEVLRGFWSPEQQKEAVDKLSQDGEEAFLPLLYRCAESMLASIGQEKAGQRHRTHRTTTVDEATV